MTDFSTASESTLSNTIAIEPCSTLPVQNAKRLSIDVRRHPSLTTTTISWWTSPTRIFRKSLSPRTTATVPIATCLQHGRFDSDDHDALSRQHPASDCHPSYWYALGKQRIVCGHIFLLSICARQTLGCSLIDTILLYFIV